MRYAFAGFLFFIFSSTVLAQTTVPYTFTAGTAAKAAEVNANFQALVTAVNSLSSRVSKLEGQITSSDLVGTYAINQFRV